jgi:hypothetical protein
VEQFGNGDKYFGVAVMMATMPGLPMFGHGQIEGLTEKYGMEYRKAYWDEDPDPNMLERHEREIFPLLRKRYLFSGAENFTLFDFYTNEGHVNENVFAFTNKVGQERALVLYNNSYGSTSGWIRQSTRINTGRGSETRFITRTLAESLDLNTSDSVFYIFRDHQKSLEFIRSGKELSEKGQYAELQGYQYSVLLDFREKLDPDGSWNELASRLGGGGVPNIEYAYREQKLAPMLDAFKAVFNTDLIERLATKPYALDADEILNKLSPKIESFLQISGEMGMFKSETGIIRDNILERLASLCIKDTKKYEWRPAFVDEIFEEQENLLPVDDDILNSFNNIKERFIIWSVFEPIKNKISGRPSDWLDKWLLTPAIVQVLDGLGVDSQEAWANLNLLKAILDYSDALEAEEGQSLSDIIEDLFNCPYLKDFMRINQYNDVLWFNKQQYSSIIFNLYLSKSIFKPITDIKAPEVARKFFAGRHFSLLRAAENGEYQVRKTLDYLR